MHTANNPNHRSAQKHSAAGFSLVEVLVAGALLGIAIIAVVATVQKSGDLQSSGSARIAARSFLSAKLEEEYGAGRYAFVQLPETNPQQVTFGDTINGRGITGDFFTTITDTVMFEVPFKEVTLSLRWTDVTGIPDSITFNAWLAE